MSLTGSVFVGMVATFTIAAFVALVLFWPRLALGGLRGVVARVGALVGMNLLVLLTAATQLNAQFLFFADWTDLRGALGGATTTTAVSRGGTAGHAAQRTVGGAAASQAPSTPPLPPEIGPDGIGTFTVAGPVSGITAKVMVQLPPGYGDPANATRRYPVIETFQGYPGAQSAWIGHMELGKVMGQKVAAKKMRWAVIVSPEIEIPDGVDTECVNGKPGTPQVESWIAEDVPAWVARTFRVETARTSWATIGLSAGGWCAGMVTMLHPAQFSAAIVMGGYFRPEFGSLYEPYPAGSPLEARYDLVALAKRDPPPVAVWLETSHADALSYRSSAELLRVVRAPFSVSATVLEHAGHRLSVWQGLLPNSLDWLGGNIPGFGAI